MTNKKNTGSYYTPKILSDFLVNHIAKNYLQNDDLSILEPSCGDGQFIKSIFKNSLINSKKININILDINKTELNKTKKLVPKSNDISLKSYHKDYLEFSLKTKKKYSLIIGNPPYIKKTNLEKSQIDRCEEIHERIKKFSSQINSTGTIKNIWPAFVKSAIMSLDNNGILCFVIPAEILQVKYAKELRALIIDTFDRVEVFAFNELIFEGIQQDVVALIGVKDLRDKKKQGFSFYQVDELNDLKEPKFTEKHSNIHRVSLDKWTNYILTDEELNFIDFNRFNYESINDLTEKAQVGIVSAANDYFILNKKELKENELNRFSSIIKPILPKGSLTPSVANFTDKDFNLLQNKNVKVNFLKFPDKPKKELHNKVLKYIIKGEKEKLHERYKMTKRENWYHVKSTWSSEGLFVKRSHLYPRIFVNQANTLATDSFYRINMLKNYSIKNFVFSFYNSLTFVLAELEGRYYGGGVLELTPNEFKNLSIPYNDNISNEQFNLLDKMLRNNENIETILKFTNSILLPNTDLISLERIRKKLVNRRMKKKIYENENINIKEIKKISISETVKNLEVIVA